MDERDQITRRYLLGELSEEEQAALERSYFTDSDVFNQVLQVESELVDAYARGQLSTEMRERFENSYLKHPSRRQRVEFAKALTTRIDEKEESRNHSSQVARSTSRVSWWQSLLAVFGGERPKLRFAIALATVLVMLAGGWIVVNNLRRLQQQREAAQIQAQRENQERRNPEPTPQQTGTPRAAEEQALNTPSPEPQHSPSPSTHSSSTTVSLALTVGGVRGADDGATQTLTIARETTEVQLTLKLKDDSYSRYRASLQKIGGAEVFTQINIRPRNTRSGASFFFTVPARQLSSGDYALTLNGVTPEGEFDSIGKSLFRVDKR